jgi:hypothetical protein
MQSLIIDFPLSYALVSICMYVYADQFHNTYGKITDTE